MKILITCGPTWVAIDDVRVISNVSTGEMGHMIARKCIKAGAKVTLIEGPVTESFEFKSVKILKYKFFEELKKIFLIEAAKKYDVIIHAAAVSDFKPEKTSKNKISSGKKLTLSLVPTPKIINQIKKIAPESFLIGFKLVSSIRASGVMKEVRHLISLAECDAVLVNDFKNGYHASICDADGQILAKANSKDKITNELIRIIL